MDEDARVTGLSTRFIWFRRKSLTLGIDSAVINERRFGVPTLESQPEGQQTFSFSSRQHSALSTPMERSIGLSALVLCVIVRASLGCSVPPCLYFANSESIKSVQINEHTNVTTVASGLRGSTAIDVHVRENMVYWSDNELHAILRKNLTSGRIDHVITADLGEVNGLAVEWESGLIYWTDYIYERIEVASVDGSLRKTLFWYGVLNPRPIVLDPGSGVMFWADWGFSDPKIEKADLSGENRETIRDLFWDWHFFPVGLTVDYEARRLYWIDSLFDEIYSINYEGYDTGYEHVTRPYINPHSLAFFNGILYWSEWNSHSIERLNVSSQPARHLPNMGWLSYEPINGIAIFDSAVQPEGSKACQTSNGGCSHLCLLTPSGSSCACPNGMTKNGATCTSDNQTATPLPFPEVEIRLVGNLSSEGRVEIKPSWKQAWGLICDDHFGKAEAAVVCSMLGYNGTSRTAPAGTFKERSGPIYLDNLKCRGDEASIAQCQHQGWGIHDCDLSEQVGVICSDSTPTVLPTPGQNETQPAPDVKVRLRNGPQSYEGRVEIYHNGQWGTICGDNYNWDINDANVVCRMLGHEAGAWSAQCCHWFGFGSGRIWLDQVHCIGNEPSISHCHHGGWGTNTCSHGSDVGVTCKFTPKPHNGSIVRLAEGPRLGIGRVEVHHESQWGTVCDDYWDIKDADVVCRMLQYSGALKALRGSATSAGNGPIWLSYVECAGNETSIADCKHGGWSGHYCTHPEDAGAVCQTESSLLDSKNFLAYSELDLGILHHISLDLVNANDTLLPISGIEQPSSVYYNPVDEFLYWSELGSGSIHRSNLNGSFPEIVIQGQKSITSIAVDRASANIYWADNGENAIFVARTSGLYMKAVVETDEPQAIALDIEGGFLYWSSSSMIPVIGRAHMDGENVTILANLSYFSTPTGLAFDKQNNRLYWVSRVSDDLQFLDLTTGRTFVLREGLQNPVGLTLYRGDLYWTSDGSGDYTGGVYKTSSAPSSNVTKVVSFLQHPTGIYAHDSNYNEGSTACNNNNNNNGGCSYLCLLNPEGRSCACPGDMQHVGDNICTFSDVLIVSDIYHSAIYEVTPNNAGTTVKSLPLGHLRDPYDLAFDSKEQRLYWTDIGDDSISRASLDGKSQEVIIDKDLSRPEGLAIDTVGRNLYWTDNTKGTIEVSRLDGTYRKLLFDINPLQPVGIALDTTRGFMYWSAWGSFNVIERSTMDGKNRQQIYVGFSWYGGPNGIFLDVMANRLYWVGEHDNSIMFLDLYNIAGGVAHSLIPYSSYLNWPHDIVVDKNFVYWIDTWEDVLVRADKDTGNNIKILVTGLSGPRGLLKISARDRNPGPSAVGDPVYVRDITPGMMYFHGMIVSVTSRLVSVKLDDGSSVDVLPNDTNRIVPDRIPMVQDVLNGTNVLARLSSRVDYLLYGMVQEVNLSRLDPYHVLFENGSAKWVALRELRAPQATHPCEVSNGGCSHLCLLRPGGLYTCACPDKLPAGEVCIDTQPTVKPPPTFPTVAPSPTPAPSNESLGCNRMPCLYFAAGKTIKAIDLQSNNGSIPVVSGLLGASALDVHVRENMIYWSDTELWVIRRMNLTSGKIEDLVTDDLGEVEGLAVEWESGMMYWTDFLFERIEVARLDGSDRKTLFYDEVHNPRGIAVDPQAGIMVWADWNLPEPKIEKASLSGDSRQTLLSLDWGDWVLLPTGIVIDVAESRVYWVDALTDIVFSMNYYGIQSELKFFMKDINPYDLALLGDTLYWSDLHTHSIERLNKTTAEHHNNFGWLSYEDVKGIAVMDSSRQPQGLQFCQIQNGGCSNLCLLSIYGPVCACPNGVELELDGKTCKNETLKPPPTPVPGLRIRLAGGNSSNEGRVEIQYKGQWGTICDDHWGIDEAKVVCHMLGFPGAVRAVDNEFKESGYGEGTGPIFLDDVKCRGDESTVAECHHKGWGMGNCDHSEDAGVVCWNSLLPTPTPLPSPGPPPNVTARLRDGEKANEGRVEIFHNGEWGTICDNYWDIMDADVICRMLGYEGAWGAECCSYYGMGSGRIWLDQANCIGDESSISHCRHGGWGNHGCTHFDDVGVTCKYTPPSPDQTVRIVDGPHLNEGRVEIFHDGYWGTICDDNWDINDADVVCRQLNFSRALSAPTLASYGQGNGHIWIDNSQCFGNESSIEGCQNDGWNEHNCQHNEDASVVCQTSELPSYDFQVDFVAFIDNQRELLYAAQITSQGEKLNETELPIRDVIKPLRIEIDPTDDSIYWSQGRLLYSEVGFNQEPGLYRSYLNGTNKDIIMSDFKADDFAIDYGGDNIYWTDTAKEGIFVASLKSSVQATLVGNVRANAIALDVGKGYMYWVSEATSRALYGSAMLEKSYMDGSMRTVIANLTGTSKVNSLTYDTTSNSLYWVDTKNKVIVSLGLDDPVPKKLVKDYLQEPYGIAVYRNYIYWSDGGTGGWSGGIYRANRDTGADIKKVVDLLGKPFDLAIKDSSLSHTGASLDCVGGNGDCSALCLRTPIGHSYACSDECILDKDNKTCIFRDVLVFADQFQKELYLLPLQKEKGAIESPLPLDVSAPVAVAFDSIRKQVYWSDISKHYIARAFLNGSSQEVVVDNVEECYGLALDPIGEVLYWSNEQESNIQVARLDGSYQTEIIKSDSGYPGGVALDISRGYMYWTVDSVFNDHSIQKAEMDGSNPEPLQTFSSWWYFYAPNSLTVDVAVNRLYWLGYHDAALEYIDLDKNDGVQTLLYHYDYLWYPFGITLDSDYIYWTDTSEDVVVRADKRTGGSLTLLVSNLHRPRGIDVYRSDMKVPDNNPCRDSSLCDHICLMKAQGYKCISPVQPTTAATTTALTTNRTTPTTPKTAPTTPDTYPTTPETTLTTPETSPTTPETTSTAPETTPTTSETSTTTPETTSTTPETTSTAPETTPTTPKTTPTTPETTPAAPETTPTTPKTTPTTPETTPTTPETTPTAPETTPTTPETTSTTAETTPTTPEITPTTLETTPTTLKTTAETTATTVSSPCTPSPCKNGGTCEVVSGTDGESGWKCQCLDNFKGDKCEFYGGDDAVVVEIAMSIDEFNETAFQIIMAEILNEECSVESCVESTTSSERIVKRANENPVFKPEDIVLAGEPKAVGDKGIEVEFGVVVKPTKDSASPVVTIPKTKLTTIVKRSSKKLGQGLGGEVTGVHEKQVEKPTTTAPTSKNGGMIVGIVVAVILIVLIAAVAIWYFRVRKPPVPYEREVDSPTQTTFENPGYTLDPQSDGLEVPPVQFHDVYSHNMTAASNPTYEVMDLKELHEEKATFQSSKPKLEFDMSDAEKKPQGPEQEEQIPEKKEGNVYETLLDVAGAIKAEEAKVPVYADPQTLDEPQYASLEKSTRVSHDEGKPNKTVVLIDAAEVSVDLDPPVREEPRYISLADSTRTPHDGKDQTTGEFDDSTA